MNAVERLEAAITKLETLTSAAPYVRRGDWLLVEDDVCTCAGASLDFAAHESNCGQDPVTNDELLVTIHRTIEAQLALMRAGLGTARHFLSISEQQLAKQSPIRTEIRDALALADAILGDNS